MSTLQWKPNVPDEYCDCDCETSGHNCYQGHTAEIADNATYVVDIRATLLVRGPRGGEHRFSVGYYKTIEEAKLGCERDYLDGIGYAKQKAKRAEAIRPVAAA
jgi:hypothetical protein